MTTTDGPREVRRRIAARLAQLAGRDPDRPPHPYLRRHLVTHAAHADTLDDDHLPAAFLPWDTSGRLRGALGLPVPQRPDARTVAAWAAVEPLLAGADTQTRRVTLATVTAAPDGSGPVLFAAPDTAFSGARWSRLQLPSDVLTAGADTSSPHVIAALPEPGGQARLGVADASGAIRIWSPTTGLSVGRPIVAGTGPVGALAAVPVPGRRHLLAVGGRDGVVRLWDPAAGRLVAELSGHSAAVGAVTPVPVQYGSSLVASGDADGEVRVWDPVAGVPVGSGRVNGSGPVTALAGLPGSGGPVLVAAARSGRIRLLDPITGETVGELEGSSGTLDVAVVPGSDGSARVAACASDGTIRLWDRAGGAAVVGMLIGHGGSTSVLAAVPLPRGRTLIATGDGEGTVRIWDPVTGRQLGHRRSETACPITALAAVPLAERTLVASVDRTGAVVLHDPLALHPRSPGDGAAEPAGSVVAMSAVRLDADASLLATLRADGVVRIRDPLTGSVRDDLRVQSVLGRLPVTALATVHRADGRPVLAVSSGTTVRLLDPAVGSPVMGALAGHSGEVRSVVAAVLPNGRALLASTGDDGTARLWDPDTGHSVGTPLPVQGTAVAIVPLSGGRFALATVGGDGAVRLREPGAGRIVGTLRLPSWQATTLATVPLPGRRFTVAIGGADGTIGLWNPATSRPVTVLAGHAAAVRAITTVPLPDSRSLLVTGGDDGTVRLWDPEREATTGSVVLPAPVTALAGVPAAGDELAALAVGTAAGITVLTIGRRAAGLPTERAVPDIAGDERRADAERTLAAHGETSTAGQIAVPSAAAESSTYGARRHLRRGATSVVAGTGVVLLGEESAEQMEATELVLVAGEHVVAEPVAGSPGMSGVAFPQRTDRSGTDVRDDGDGLVLVGAESADEIGSGIVVVFTPVGPDEAWDRDL